MDVHIFFAFSLISSVCVSCRHVKIFRRGSARLSFKECKVDVGLRKDCGYFGIDESHCYERGCCWGESEVEGVPWCYHSKITDVPQCAVDNLDRLECGSYGITKEACLASKCCWKPANEYGIPWCFHYKRVPIFNGDCGLTPISPNIRALGRIVGGMEAKPHSWPWQIAIPRSEERHCCGGSIINDQWILSAAHCEGCLDGVNEVKIGMHSQNEQSEFQRTMKVKHIITHDGYNPRTIDNDIMLLKLSEKIQFGTTIQPVCLPKENQERLKPGTKCYATGWGTTTHGGEIPDKLQQTILPAISTELCNSGEYYSNLTGGSDYYDLSVTDNMVCVGYEEGGRGACHGDSGGPLVSFENENWVQYGIASWVGRRCAEEFSPTVYARVSNYIPWIEKQLAKYP